MAEVVRVRIRARRCQRRACKLRVGARALLPDDGSSVIPRAAVQWAHHRHASTLIVLVVRALPGLVRLGARLLRGLLDDVLDEGAVARV